ncbi:MAG: hypothetical protein JXN60_04480 [Lentisphaerae bacterium]|nr:hypothetical protein [Lentisphaerota bacterium]
MNAVFWINTGLNNSVSAIMAAVYVIKWRKAANRIPTTCCLTEALTQSSQKQHNSLHTPDSRDMQDGRRPTCLRQYFGRQATKQAPAQSQIEDNKRNIEAISQRRQVENERPQGTSPIIAYTFDYGL